MTTITISTTLGILPIVVTWGIMIIPVLSHREILHSSIQFSSLLVVHLGISILSVRSTWFPVRVTLGKVLHIVTRFTTAVTVARYCNLLIISSSTTPAASTTVDFFWRWISLGGSGHGIRHSSGDRLAYHGMKCHRLSR